MLLGAPARRVQREEHVHVAADLVGRARQPEGQAELAVDLALAPAHLRAEVPASPGEDVVPAAATDLERRVALLEQGTGAERTWQVPVAGHALAREQVPVVHRPKRRVEARDGLLALTLAADRPEEVAGAVTGEAQGSQRADRRPLQGQDRQRPALGRAAGEQALLGAPFRRGATTCAPTPRWRRCCASVRRDLAIRRRRLPGCRGGRSRPARSTARARWPPYPRASA